jgi:hypothetical protein
MNFKEGMRRVALFAGVLGAILGCLASYAVLRDAQGELARYKQFDAFTKSDAVQQEQNSWTLTLRYTPDEAIEAFRKLPENRQRDVFAGLAQEERADLTAKLKCEPLSLGSPSTAATLENLSHVDPYAEYQHAKDDPYACTAEASDPPASIVHKGGIKAIHWSRVLSVESVETEDGKTLYPTPAPSLRPCLLAIVFPVFGFVIPWASARALAWVGVGFFEKSK